MTELKDRLVSPNHTEKWLKEWLEGWEEGRIEQKISMARTMLADGMSKELVMKYTGLTLKQIEEIGG